MNQAKQQILEAAARLFEKQGYTATGLNEIVRESGAPKGSLYYYFPEGKEQIGAETALWSGEQMAGRIRAALEQSPEAAEAVSTLARGIAGAVEESGYSAGGPLMILAAETAAGSERLNAACREAYRLMLVPFVEKLNGNEPLARFVLSTLEGAILLSRVNHSGDALRQAADGLADFIRRELSK